MKLEFKKRYAKEGESRQEGGNDEIPRDEGGTSLTSPDSASDGIVSYNGRTL